MYSQNKCWLKIAFALTTFCLILANALAAPFNFIALGDMPYNQANDFPRFERLISRMNSENPAFSIFVGDTKSGSSPCTNEHVEKMMGYFNSLKAPLVYSIGDNEWTDCHRALAGGYDPLERLDHIRATQFQSNQSFGKTKMKLQRQGDVMPQHSKYIENALWVKNNFLFVNLHIPGSNNNLGRDEASNQEYISRNAANLAWIDYAFEQAKIKKYAGIVLAFQADIFYSPDLATSPTSGYRDTLNKLSKLSETASTPILLIHGDSHRLKIDQPLYGSNKKILENVYRLEVMGADQMQAVQIQVNERQSSPFSFRPLLIRENISPTEN
ncbi:MAG: hypothetical protein ACOYK2_02960 [Polynucleobacter sp.]